METIFDYNPTDKELTNIRFDSLSLYLKFGIDIKEELTPTIYKEVISQQNSYYDLACLFEFRNDIEKANGYWNKLTRELKINELGFNSELIIC